MSRTWLSLESGSASCSGPERVYSAYDTRHLRWLESLRYHSNVPVNEPRALRVLSTDELCNFPCFKGDVVARLRAAGPTDRELERARRLFGALADRTRLKILHALKDGEELCVCDVAHVLGVGVSAASHHLRRLRDLGFLKHRNDGKMAYYSLRDHFVARLVSQALGRRE